jgi:hypothetical protein
MNHPTLCNWTLKLSIVLSNNVPFPIDAVWFESSCCSSCAFAVVVKLLAKRMARHAAITSVIAIDVEINNLLEILM